MSSQTTLLSILGLITAAFFGSMWVIKTINDRADEILCGVVKGMPVSAGHRWLMLFHGWVPYAGFSIAYLLVMGVGVWVTAQGVEEPTVRMVGYMCATLCAGGAVFWLVLGSVFFARMRSVLVRTTRT